MEDDGRAYQALKKSRLIQRELQSNDIEREIFNASRIHHRWLEKESALQSEVNLALIRAKEEAEKSSAFKSAFLANMSHEIRTPMNGVLGMSKILLNRQLPHAERELVKNIYAAGSHLLRVVNDILEFSSIEAGKLKIDSQPFELRERITRLVSLLKPLAEDKSNSLNCEIADEIGDAVVGDFSRISQVLTNLLGNAIKFTNHGDIVLKLTLVSGALDQQRVRFVVSDTGIGIPPERQSAIFDAYVQGDRIRVPGSEGTGLGLSISKLVVEALGGKINLESQEGLGSRFWFDIDLPEDNGLVAKVETPLERKLALLNEKALSGVRILVAEDNEINWLVTEELLQRLGGVADRAEDGRQAVEAFRGGKYDLILMDCQMPVLDGYEATQVIRGLEKKTQTHIPIIALSADVLPDNQIKCTFFGMDGFVGKPISVTHLLGLVMGVAPNLVTPS